MTKHSVVALFYKYFFLESSPQIMREHRMFYEGALHRHQQDLCSRLQLRGRVLLSMEGINGTVSAESQHVLNEYMNAMQEFDLLRDCGTPNGVVSHETSSKLYENIDWKQSKVDEHTVEPFPDLKVSVVKEIVSTGGALTVDEIPALGGAHLTPREFHETLSKNKDVVLIDVRNTFECEIGHFINPHTGEAAINPQMVTFSSFEHTFCAKKADELKDKKVLMYCTGGIRCEKASAMLKKRGVRDVSQLQGGIHRYLEEYSGEDSLFKGKNFVFDQRVALAPTVNEKESCVVVGACRTCAVPFDEISGSRLCTVCRDLVLVCPKCQNSFREYHCRRHESWKECYFTFLDVFSEEELISQKEKLTRLWETQTPPSQNKNVRRTLKRQLQRVQEQIEKIKAGEVTSNRNAPRRCRTCMETSDICDGLCFGFWKHSQVTGVQRWDIPPALPIKVGDTVEPGPHWNVLRLGIKDSFKRGTVVEIKSWASEGDANDCVSVIWETGGSSQIYRWGFLARNRKRMYDVQRVLKRDRTSSSA